MSEIQSYLQNPSNYTEGVELLKKYAPESNALIIVSLGENSVTWKKLLAALGDVDAKTSTDSLIKAKAPKYTEEDKANWPAQIVKLYHQAIELIRKRSAIHQALQILVYGKDGHVKKFSQAKGAKLTEEIMDLTSHIDLLMYQVDYWRENGKMAPGTAPMDERQRLIYWLSNQMNYAGYCRNVEAAKRTKDNALYTYRKSVLNDIDQYLLLNGTVR